MEQTELMKWVKQELTHFYSDLRNELSERFSFWNKKQDNGEYIWFCCLNQSCQAGFIIEFINKVKSNKKSWRQMQLRKKHEYVFALSASERIIGISKS